jgi:outer membrane protein OmpA-like peptidoglycan-associated protein
MDGRDVSAASRATLDAVAQQFAQHPEILRVQVECRTDAGGSDRRNVRASTACARAVVRYLRRAGVAKRRLRASGAGSLHAAAGAPQTQVTLTIVESASAPAAGPTPTGGEEGGRRGRRGRHGRRRH